MTAEKEVLKEQGTSYPLFVITHKLSEGSAPAVIAEVIFDGTKLTIERTTSRRSPTASALNIESITTQNIGALTLSTYENDGLEVGKNGIVALHLANETVVHIALRDLLEALSQLVTLDIPNPTVGTKVASGTQAVMPLSFFDINRNPWLILNLARNETHGNAGAQAVSAELWETSAQQYYHALLRSLIRSLDQTFPELQLAHHLPLEEIQITAPSTMREQINQKLLGVARFLSHYVGKTRPFSVYERRQIQAQNSERRDQLVDTAKQLLELIPFDRLELIDQPSLRVRVEDITNQWIDYGTLRLQEETLPTEGTIAGSADDGALLVSHDRGQTALGVTTSSGEYQEYPLTAAASKVESIGPVGSRSYLFYDRFGRLLAEESLRVDKTYIHTFSEELQNLLKGIQEVSATFSVNFGVLKLERLESGDYFIVCSKAPLYGDDRRKHFITGSVMERRALESSTTAKEELDILFDLGGNSINDSQIFVSPFNEEPEPITISDGAIISVQSMPVRKDPYSPAAALSMMTAVDRIEVVVTITDRHSTRHLMPRSFGITVNQRELKRYAVPVEENVNSIPTGADHVSLQAGRWGGVTWFLWPEAFEVTEVHNSPAITAGARDGGPLDAPIESSTRFSPRRVRARGTADRLYGLRVGSPPITPFDHNRPAVVSADIDANVCLIPDLCVAVPMGALIDQDRAHSALVIVMHDETPGADVSRSRPSVIINTSPNFGFDGTVMDDTKGRMLNQEAVAQQIAGLNLNAFLWQYQKYSRGFDTDHQTMLIEESRGMSPRSGFRLEDDSDVRNFIGFFIGRTLHVYEALLLQSYNQVIDCNDPEFNDLFDGINEDAAGSLQVSTNDKHEIVLLLGKKRVTVKSNVEEPLRLWVLSLLQEFREYCERSGLGFRDDWTKDIERRLRERMNF